MKNKRRLLFSIEKSIRAIWRSDGNQITPEHIHSFAEKIKQMLDDLTSRNAIVGYECRNFYLPGDDDFYYDIILDFGDDKPVTINFTAVKEIWPPFDWRQITLKDVIDTALLLALVPFILPFAVLERLTRKQ